MLVVAFGMQYIGLRFAGIGRRRICIFNHGSIARYRLLQIVSIFFCQQCQYISPGFVGRFLRLQPAYLQRCVITKIDSSIIYLPKHKTCIQLQVYLVVRYFMQVKRH